MATIRACTIADAGAMLSIVNAAAEAYRGVIADDCWREPYMPAAELAIEMEAGVAFWGSEIDGALVAVMGVQPSRDVDLIRHAYVLPSRQRFGLGGALLAHLRRQTERRMLVGTWAVASWAIQFYQRHGFELVSADRTAALLKTYWRIPDRQIAASVALANPRLEHV